MVNCVKTLIDNILITTQSDATNKGKFFPLFKTKQDMAQNARV